MTSFQTLAIGSVAALLCSGAACTRANTESTAPAPNMSFFVTSGAIYAADVGPQRLRKYVKR
jgi:hypothetical protein